MFKTLIRFLDRIDLLFDVNRAAGCPNCGNYRLKFYGQWECPQSSYWCGIWDRLGKKQTRKPWQDQKIT